MRDIEFPRKKAVQRARKVSIKALRDLRALARSLNCSALDDLSPFTQENGVTFRRRPGSPTKDINITTTCTVQMGLAANYLLGKVYSDKCTKDDATCIIERLVEADWVSSGLRDGNPFTPILLLRNAGFLASSIKDSTPAILALRKANGRWAGKTLADVILDLTKQHKDIPGCFQLDTTLRPNPALGYWLVDAIDKLGMAPDARIPEEFWTRLSHWTSYEYSRQHSLVASRHDIMMDPIALAMAACLSERLRKIANQTNFPCGDKVKDELPTPVELAKALALLLPLQQPSGVWDKFFPMFYYREDKHSGKPDDHLHRGGANYCFSFEFLEAILNEFGHQVASVPAWLKALRKSCEWCNQNRLTYYHDSKPYQGWSSGQQVDSLARGEPESWATAVVHMFLKQVDNCLTNHIESRLRTIYEAKPSSRPWDVILDCDVKLPSGECVRAKKLIERYIEEPLKQNGQIEKNINLRQDKIKDRRSVLLFGPPGTSKTTLVRAFAKKMDWPCIEITPSHFLRDGLPRIYERADAVFQDLDDLQRVVVFFDEMDALVQRRDPKSQTGSLDITSQFLTTSMLPKLAKLHDDGRVIFFMATNHQSNFDAAIKRPGRFDLLICLGVPTWQDKLKAIEAFWRNKDKTVDWDALKKKLTEFTADNKDLESKLDLFSVDEIKAMFDDIRKGNSLLEALQASTLASFQNTVHAWSKVIVLCGDPTTNSLLKEYKEDMESSKLQ